MPNKFYKTTITIIVLSEEPIGNVPLSHLQELVDNGPCVLHSNQQRERAVGGKQMANLLHEAGSEPGFFNLDDHGKPTDE